MEYIYLFTFLLAIPLVWNILYTLRFESLFKRGKEWQIKVSYILLTAVCSHLIAETLQSFVNSIYSLF